MAGKPSRPENRNQQEPPSIHRSRRAESIEDLRVGKLLTASRKESEMKTTLKFSLLALVLACGATKYASATPNQDRCKDNNPPSAPEVDPGVAMSGLTLLGGMLTVLRSKRSK
jgi:hypothetical protein